MNKVMAGRSIDPSDNLKMKPPKGILKSSSSFEAPDVPGGSRKFSQKGNKETTFDEMNILETLHPPGKDYGHMKIDEPKTPYERDVPDSTGVDPDDLARRMAEESNKPRRDSPLMEEESEGEDLTPEDREKKRQFEMKRKAHYNEFLMAKKKLQELKDEDDDDDNDDD